MYVCVSWYDFNVKHICDLGKSYFKLVTVPVLYIMFCVYSSGSSDLYETCKRKLRKL